MFKKFVSNLPFSPALVGQIGFYAKRLRKEQATRRLGLLFTVMAVILQTFAVLVPPQQAFASSANDMVAGGITSRSEAIATYDQGTDFETILNYVGITRADIVALNEQTQKRCGNDESLVIFGRQPLFSAAEGEVAYTIPNNGQSFTLYSRPLNVFDKRKNTCHTVLTGSSATAGNFAIDTDSGNVLLHQQKHLTPAVSTSIKKSKAAHSLTNNRAIDDSYTVTPTERIEYTLTTSNTGTTDASYSITEPLADTLEYAKLIDAGGGLLNETTKTLVWPAITLTPGAIDVRKVVVQINSTIPPTPHSASNPSSFDCVITNIYGNTLNIAVACPTAKVVETTTQDLPTTGTGINIVFGSLLLAVVTYFYARSRQLTREVKLIRKEFSAGAL